MVNSSEIIASGDPRVDERAFRRCLGQFATGVTVVTANVGGRLVGVTANSFSSLSLDPPLILWSIKRSARSFSTFAVADHFAVNILAGDQISLSQAFASSSEDKFADISWRKGMHGSPVLENVVATLECTRQTVHDGGDHIIIVGRVDKFTLSDKSPLLFAQGRYALAQDHPNAGRQDSGKVVGVRAEWPALLSLLFRAYQAASIAFEKHRSAEKLSLVQSRIIYALYERPMTTEEISTLAYIPIEVTRDVVSDLTSQGMLLRDGGKLTLSERGREIRDAVRRRSDEFYEETLKWAPAKTVEHVAEFLNRYINELEKGRRQMAQRADEDAASSSR